MFFNSKTKHRPFKQSHVTAIMIGLFFVAIALAASMVALTKPELFTNLSKKTVRPKIELVAQNFEQLQISLPKNWQITRNIWPKKPTKPILTRQDPHKQTHRLLLSRFDAPAPISSLKVLNLIMLQLLEKVDLKNFNLRPQTTQSNPQWMVYRFIATNPIPSGIQSHLFALLTEDAKTYWLIYLSNQHRDADTFRDDLYSDDQLLNEIIATCNNSVYGNATKTQLKEIGLATNQFSTNKAALFSARLPKKHLPNSPIRFHISFDDNTAPRMLLARGVPSLPHDPKNNSWSIIKQLSQTFTLVTGHAPSQRDLTQGTWRFDHNAEALTYYRLRYRDEHSLLRKQAIVRTVYYIQHSSKPIAILLETLDDPLAHKPNDRWVANIARQLIPNKSLFDFKQAIKKGIHIAATSREHLFHNIQRGFHYYLMRQEKKRLGIQLEKIKQASKPSRNLLGQTLILLNDPQKTKIQYRWQLSTNGNIFQTLTQQKYPEESDALNCQTTLTNQKLSFINHSTTKQWEIKISDNYLLDIAQDYWPTEALDGATDAVLWFRLTKEKPMPYWCHIKKINTANTSEKTAYQLQCRPLFSMRANRISLNAQGQMIHFLGQDLTASHASSVAFSIERVNSLALQEIFPQWAKQISHWTLEQISDAPIQQIP